MNRAMLATLLLCAAPALRAAEPELFPFVLPWDDASPGPANISGWQHKPAGKLGHVHAGPDGHLYAGSERIRFFGVNLAYAANFPRKPDADKIAARMAKFGINAVRFHHLEQFPFPNGIRAGDAGPTSRLSPEAVDRLDYLIARLKDHGIYANLNLLVSRPFTQADGLPAEIEQIADWKDRHVVGFFDARARATQKEYARALLGHRNPYTKLTYTEDPAVAFVEINNENGLIHAWLGGQVERLPEVFRRELAQQWNDWLRKRHASIAALRQAWGARQEALGGERLKNERLAGGLEPWFLEQHGNAQAKAAATDVVPGELSGHRSVRVDVTRAGAAGWHVQLGQPGLAVKAGELFTLQFWAKADKPRSLRAVLSQAHEPWQNLGLDAEARLTTDWKPFRFSCTARTDDANARVIFSDLAGAVGSVWLAGISLRPGGSTGLEEGQSLESGMPLFAHNRFAGQPAGAQRDWLRFLWETEDGYWKEMQQYLKDELHVKGVTIGTIIGCSTPHLMARFDAVDTHAYWQHPDFPGQSWDPENWIVRNKSMVNEAGGTIPGLALSRVLGKPHCVTEYSHPAPNTSASEGLLLLAAYAGLQDWDALFAFGYSHRDTWNTGHVTGFFDIDQHPAKMATLIPAVAMFVRGDVQPARAQVIIPFSRERELEELRAAHAWGLLRTGDLGVPRQTTLLHRTALRLTANELDKTPTGDVGVPQEKLFTADTGELAWDLRQQGRGVATISAPKSKAVIGYGGGRRFDLGAVTIEPGPSQQDGWSCLTLTATDGDFAKGHILITTTGLVENEKMQWKSAAHESVGRNWGTAPSRVEGIPATITLSAQAKNCRLWALDEKGQRGQAVPVQAGPNGRAQLALDAKWQTLWYEVELR